MRNYQTYEVWDTITPVAITSSTDATPIVVTATSHGFATGDLVMIYGHGTNVAANGIYKIVKVDANSFQLTNRYTGANIAGTGAGAGSGGVVVACPKIVLLQDFKLLELHFMTSGTATLTVQFAISNGLMRGDESGGHGDTPNFGATVGKDNPYTFALAVDLATGAAVNGATGAAVAGTDFNKTYEVNINGAKYFCPIVSAFTQGAITLKAVVMSED